MIHTEKQIIEKGNKVLNDLFGSSYMGEKVDKAFYNPEEQLLRGGPGNIAAWKLVVTEPVTDSFLFITVADDTGEPRYIQGKHTVSVIKKDAAGNYYRDAE
jgi:hypothetical protein